MAYSLLWWPSADESMTRLDTDPTMKSELHAVRRTLGRLEVDPFGPRQRTRQFVTDELRQIRATPSGRGEWHVFWQMGEEAGTLEIIQVAEVSL